MVVDCRCLGVGNNQSSRVQATRLYTTSYQTVRIQDWKDYIDLQGAILKPYLQQPGGPRGPADYPHHTPISTPRTVVLELEPRCLGVLGGLGCKSTF